jgi:hypothetical protein
MGGSLPTRDPRAQRPARDVETDEHDRLYVQNAFATLSPTRDLVRWGGWAGLHAGGAGLALLAGALLMMILALFTIGEAGGGASYYGQTPLSGTPFEVLWPIVLALPVLPYYGLVGIVAALLRRAGNRWRRAIDRYHDPVSPLLDFAGFWVATSLLMLAMLIALNLIGRESSYIGIFVLVFSAGGLFSRPLYLIWRSQYLWFIRRHGRAPFDEIVAHLVRQTAKG